VFAGGNEGPGQSTIGLPGGCPQTLAVGATDQNDKIASFSSRGPVQWKTGTFIKPDVSAPGVGVLSSVPGGGYKSYSGTSMATPHVAGTAALIYQGAPNATIEAVKGLLEKNAVDLGDHGQDNVFGYGRIDAMASIKMLSAMLHEGGHGLK
jgi:subtilisin family serine protease